jgi:serine protease Do
MNTTPLRERTSMRLIAILATLLAPALVQAQVVVEMPPIVRRPFRDDRANTFHENPRVLAAFRQAIVQPARSVVRVRAENKDVALGTIVAADGWILTKGSQLPDDTKLTVLLRNGRSLAASVTGVDQRNDLAMLKVDAKDLVPIQWAEGNKPAIVGELLAAPGMSVDPAAVGVLSVAARHVRPRDLPPPTPPANAGYLGVQLEEDQGGARILRVMPNSAADKAGLKADDVVTHIADMPIIDSESMVNTIQHHKPGDVVAIKLRRKGELVEMKVSLDKRPADPGFERRDYQNRMGSELSDRRGGFAEILQHDLVLRPIDCGGPVVDLDGKAIGINIARAGRVESYAIPADAVRAVIEDLKKGNLPTATTQPATRSTTRPTKP